jgi:hypothetical protein
MVYSVKQLTDGYCCIIDWQRSGFTSAFAPGEQKKLKRLTLNPLLPNPLGYECLLMSIIAPHMVLLFV